MILRNLITGRTHTTSAYYGQRRRRLSSELLRACLAHIQHAELARGRPATINSIARSTGRSTNVIARYVRTLRDAGLITFDDNQEGTIRVGEWL